MCFHPYMCIICLKIKESGWDNTHLFYEEDSVPNFFSEEIKSSEKSAEIFPDVCNSCVLNVVRNKYLTSQCLCCQKTNISKDDGLCISDLNNCKTIHYKFKLTPFSDIYKKIYDRNLWLEDKLPKMRDEFRDYYFKICKSCIVTKF